MCTTKLLGSGLYKTPFFLLMLQVLTAEAPSYLSRHKQLVQTVLHAAGRIGLSDQVTDRRSA